MTCMRIVLRMRSLRHGAQRTDMATVLVTTKHKVNTPHVPVARTNKPVVTLKYVNNTAA